MFYSDFPATQSMPVTLYQEEWVEPKKVIKDLFEKGGLPDCIRDVTMWVRFAFRKKMLPPEKVLDIHETYKETLRLLEMGSLLPEGQMTPPIPDNADWMERRWWVANTWRGDMDFDYFPRHLSRTEYANPYEVFYKCRRKYDLVNWRMLLDDLWIHGCSNVHMYEFMDHASLASDYKPLPKIFEAAHLIYVRELAEKKSPRRKAPAG